MGLAIFVIALLLGGLVISFRRFVLGISLMLIAEAISIAANAAMGQWGWLGLNATCAALLLYALTGYRRKGESDSPDSES